MENKAGFLRRTCAVTAHDQIRGFWLHPRMPLWQDFKKRTLNHPRQKETYHCFSEKPPYSSTHTHGLLSEFGKLLELLNSMKMLQPDKFSNGFQSIQGQAEYLETIHMLYGNASHVLRLVSEFSATAHSNGLLCG